MTVKLKGGYSGTAKKTFTIRPKGTSISKVSQASKGFTVKWKKQKTQTTGYQIQYSTSSKFTGKTTKTKTVTVEKNSTISKKLTKLKANKKYYVRVRAYKNVFSRKNCICCKAIRQKNMTVPCERITNPRTVVAYGPGILLFFQ